MGENEQKQKERRIRVNGGEEVKHLKLLAILERKKLNLWGEEL